MDRKRIDELNRLLISNERARKAGAESAPNIESVPAAATLSDPATILHRTERSIAEVSSLPTFAAPRGRSPAAGAIEEAVGRKGEENAAPSSADVATARDMLLGQGETALAKLAGGIRELSRNETAALEAIVIADGTRPSFLLSDGRVDANDPFIGNWANPVATHGDRARKVARATGRIQPAHGHASRFIGTGALVESIDGKSRVLTNFHVIDDARNRFGVAMSSNGRSLKVDGTLEIDFLGEAKSLHDNRFRITDIDLPEGFGRGFGHLDAAVATIEPIDGGSALPPAVPLLSRDNSFANGGMVSLATVGFPGPPDMSSGPDIDWNFVLRTLFGNKFGFKRLAPGSFTSGRGSDPADAQTKMAFGHDATTFGGASGSLVFAWADDGPPSFGLHFVGATGRENHAVALAVAADALEAIGVKFE